MNIDKTPKQLERYFKGVANHRRIKILNVVKNNPGISVEGIAEITDCNFKTISSHTQKLVQAGLVSKKYIGRSVSHALSPYGHKMHKFLSSFK